MENPNDHDQPSRLPTLRDLAQPIFRQRRVVIGCLLVVSLGVATAVLLSPRVYEAELKILVKRDRVDSVVTGTSEQPGAGNLEVSEQDLMSEVELLKGRDLLERVVQVARLHERPMVRERSRTPTEAVAIATSELRRDLTIQPIRKTRMVSVSYRSEDRNTAQHVLDTFSRLYLEKHLAVRRPPGVHDFFTAQAEQSLKELRGARAQLDEFTARTHVVSAEAEKQTVLEKLGEFEAERRQAEAGIAETSRRIAALERELAAAPVSRTSEVRTSDDADLMREVKAQILALELKRSQLLQKFTPRYRAVQEVEEQLRQARAALDDARRAPVKAETVTTNPTREWVENEIARARTELAATTARARALGTAVARYRQNAQELEVRDAEQQELLRDVKAAEERHLLYQRKQEEARISDALDQTRIANVAIAQAPTVPFKAARSRSLLWLPFGVAVALLLGVAAAFVIDGMAATVRTPQELRLALDAPVLAYVPAARERRPA